MKDFEIIPRIKSVEVEILNIKTSNSAVIKSQGFDDNVPSFVIESVHNLIGNWGIFDSDEKMCEIKVILLIDAPELLLNTRRHKGIIHDNNFWLAWEYIDLYDLLQFRIMPPVGERLKSINEIKNWLEIIFPQAIELIEKIYCDVIETTF